MKQAATFILIGILCLSMFIGCADSDGTATSEDKYKVKKESILTAWTGEYSKDKRKDIIGEYEQNYTPVVFEKETPYVSIETDYEISSCNVPLLSPTDKDDISVELNRFIDLAVNTELDGNKIIVHTDWWTSDGSTKEYKVWSYLVRAVDTDGNEHCYYFRVDYSAYAASQT